MLNKIILSIIFLASLAWIVFIGFDISNDSNNYSPEYLFNHEDGELLIIVRPAEVDLTQLSEFNSSPIAEIFNQLNDSTYKQGYLSQNRAQLLLTKSVNWTSEDIKNLFKNDLPRELTSSEFKIGAYSGRYYKSNLYIWKGELSRSEKANTLIFDKKASASIIHFKKTVGISSYTDIYFKHGGRIDYVTINKDTIEGKQVRDEILFGEVVTKKFSSYHFLERDYYASIDSIYKDSPLFQWTLNGFIELIYNGEKVIISDYIEGQDPILVLNDLSQTLDTSSFKIPLTSSFPENNHSYTIKYLEDLVVIAELEGTIDKIIADYKLGNTIALSERTRNKLFSSLPQSVSERFVNEQEAFSRSVYNGKLLEAHTGIKSIKEEVISQEAISLSCGYEISDFIALPGNGNVITLGTNGEVTFFEKEKELSKGKVNGKLTGDLQLIDLHYNGENYVLFNTQDEIHLWNMNGDYQRGFPIKLENEASNSIKFYRWKGKSYFLIATENNDVIHFDSQGRELNIIKSKINITRQIDVWASQKKLFAGFANQSDFVMYSMEKSKIHREFVIPPNTYSSKIPNELYQFVIEENKLVRYDQKGLRTQFSSFNNPKILSVINNDLNPIIIVQSANEIHVLNTDGVSFAEIKLPFNEIDNIFIEKANTGETYIAIIDGLENNVYLYNTNSERVLNKLLEGKTKVVINTIGKTKQITTIVDQFIIQYFEN